MMKKKPIAYTRIGSVAIIEVHGVMTKRAYRFMRWSGGASTEMIMDAFAQAIGDASIKSILFNIDSPGGPVDGSFTLCRICYKARGQKPVVAFANGQASSAAYYWRLLATE